MPLKYLVNLLKPIVLASVPGASQTTRSVQVVGGNIELCTFCQRFTRGIIGIIYNVCRSSVADSSKARMLYIKISDFVLRNIIFRLIVKSLGQKCLLIYVWCLSTLKHYTKSIDKSANYIITLNVR